MQGVKGFKQSRMQIETGKDVWKEVCVGSAQWATHVFFVFKQMLMH